MIRWQFLQHRENEFSRRTPIHRGERIWFFYSFRLSKISKPYCWSRQGECGINFARALMLCGFFSAMDCMKERGRMTSDSKPRFNPFCFRQFRSISRRCKKAWSGRGGFVGLTGEDLNPFFTADMISLPNIWICREVKPIFWRSSTRLGLKSAMLRSNLLLMILINIIFNN